MRISKTAINSLLVVLACITMLSITSIVRATSNANKAITVDNVSYELPFPGILPDNIFYKVKMARDKLWEFLISDLEKKVYFEILMADKRVSAARVLIEEKQKIDLGISTFTKGYKYLEKTPSIVRALRERNYNVNNVIDKLENATLKHTSLISKFLKRSDLTQVQKEDLQALLKMYQDFEQKVTSLH
jgi:hypothetical protein